MQVVAVEFEYEVGNHGVYAYDSEAEHEVAHYLHYIARKGLHVVENHPTAYKGNYEQPAAYPEEYHIVFYVVYRNIKLGKNDAIHNVQVRVARYKTYRQQKQRVETEENELESNFRNRKRIHRYEYEEKKTACYQQYQLRRTAVFDIVSYILHAYEYFYQRQKPQKQKFEVFDEMFVVYVVLELFIHFTILPIVYLFLISSSAPLSR